MYPLSATGHPLLPPRASTQMQLAVMQQQFQQQRQSELKHYQCILCGLVTEMSKLNVNLMFRLNCFCLIFTVHQSFTGPQSQSQGPHRTNGSQRHGGSPPLGLSKWFGSDVLEQPLPSMPAKVISVDELEFRP